VRDTLQMTPGKVASQAGHAYVGALWRALQLNCPRAQDYLALNPGTKVCLRADPTQLARAHDAALALGVGPCTAAQAKHALGKLRLF
jgi:peptidyl-tRNA hydrolase